MHQTWGKTFSAKFLKMMIAQSRRPPTQTNYCKTLHKKLMLSFDLAAMAPPLSPPLRRRRRRPLSPPPHPPHPPRLPPDPLPPLPPPLPPPPPPPPPPRLITE